MNELNRNIIIDILKDNIPYLNQKYHLKKIGLFGSYAKQMQSEKSDIDLIVDFDKPIGFDFVELCEYLEQLLNRKVDLLTFEGLKNSNINLKSEMVIYVN